MELADQVESLETVPEPFRSFYSEAEEGGRFTLDSEGLGGAVKNHRSLLGEKKKLAEKLKSYDGLDPEAARKAIQREKELETELQKLRDKAEASAAGTTDEEIDKLLKARTQRMAEDHTATLTAKEKAIRERDERLAKLESELATRVIDSEVTLAATVDGFVAEAVEDAVTAARRIFRMEEGRAVPRDGDGQLILGKDGEKPLTIKEWLLATKSSKPHWWKAQANGGGATASHGGNGSKTISRAAMRALSAEQQMAKAREGWTVTD